MPLIVCGCVVPMLIALLVWIRTSGAHPAHARRRTDDVAGAHPGSPRVASRWEGLTEEIAQRGNRRPPRRSDPTARRRHLAAVLPADARR